MTATSVQQSLDRLGKKILKKLEIQDATLDIFLLSHDKMAAMKWKLMKKKTEPNVLSFPEPVKFPHPEKKKRHLGDVFLNRDILKKSPERTTPLLVHGILHLLGYDHEKKNDKGKMERMEKKVIGMLDGKKKIM